MRRFWFCNFVTNNPVNVVPQPGGQGGKMRFIVSGAFFVCMWHWKRACSSQMSRENYTSGSLMNGWAVSGGGLWGSSLMSWEPKHCQSLPRPCFLVPGQSEERFNSGPLKQRGMASRWFPSFSSQGRNNALLCHASSGIMAPNLIRRDLISWKMGISLKLSHA